MTDGETPESDSARRAWQGREPDDGPDARSSRQRFRVIVLTGVLSALVTTVVALLLYFSFPPPAPHFLAINVAEQNERYYPVQAFARADSELLMRHFEDGKIREAPPSQEGLRKELSDLRGRPAQSPLVIHIAGLALVRDDKVYLLPADASPDNDAKWLKVDEVLDAVEKCPAKQKLLILDLAHALIDPRLGVLTDRVAATLEAYFHEEPSFLVLCSCSAGESSLTSEVLRSSVLAFYLDQGLGGDADENQDGNVTVRELVTFITPRVDRWARNNRGLRQQPRLFGPEKGDFIIAPVNRPKPAKIPLKAPDPYPEALEDAWKKRDEAWNRGAFREAPRKLLQLEASLLRHESRWQAGAAGKVLVDEETGNLIRDLAALRPAPPSPSLSLVNAKENLALADALYNVLRRGSDVTKTQAEALKILLEAKNADYLQLARLIVDALSRFSEMELTHDHLKTAQAVLAGKGNEPLVEVLYLDRLARFAAREYRETFQKARVETVWKAMRDREVVLAALDRDPEFLPWVALAIENADKKRRAAEGQLLWKRPPAWPEALKDLEFADKTYVDVKKTLAEMQTGRAALDRAFAELPAHLRILADGPDADPEAELTWLQAADEAAFLQSFFVAPPGPRNVADAKLDTHGRDLQMIADAKLDTHGRDLRIHLEELMRKYRIRLQGAENPDTAKAQRQLRCLLQGPLLKAHERAELIKVQEPTKTPEKKILLKVHERADLINKLRISAKKLHDATEGNDEPGAKAPQKNTGLARAKMSLALLRLAGDARDLALPIPKEQGSLAATEKELHHLWGEEGLFKRWREASHDRRGDALSRLVSPWDLPKKDEDHTRLWQMNLRDDHLRWLHRQYVSESLETGPRDWKEGDKSRDQEARDFFRDVARKLTARLADRE